MVVSGCSRQITVMTRGLAAPAAPGHDYEVHDRWDRPWTVRVKNHGCPILVDINRDSSDRREDHTRRWRPRLVLEVLQVNIVKPEFLRCV